MTTDIAGWLAGWRNSALIAFVLAAAAANTADISSDWRTTLKL